MSTSRKNSKQAARGHRAQVAVFGAALGTLAIGQAAPAEANVIDLTSLVSSVLNNYGGLFNGLNVGLGSAGSFFQFNDSLGKTLKNVGGGITGFVSAQASSILTSDRVWNNYFQHGLLSGTRTFGFRTDTGQLGWIRMNLGGAGGGIHYLAAAFNDTPDGSIHVGSVPEPATTALVGLSLLAMGARGVRRLREQRKPARTDAAAS